MLVKERSRISLCTIKCIQRCHRYLIRNKSTTNQQEQPAGKESPSGTDSDKQANSHQNSDHHWDESSWSSNHRRHTRRSYEHKRANLNLNADASSTKSLDSLTHYQRLNVEQGADSSEIKSAYYALSKIYHPDVVGSYAADNFRLITESYDTLTDPKRRAQYDAEISTASDLSTIEFSAWAPKGGSMRDPNDLMRGRTAADMIYKMRQEAAALEQERLKNPTKFRAGSFTRTANFDYNRDEELSKLESRLKDMDTQFNSGKSKDMNEFYRTHARDTILRRRTELSIGQDHYRNARLQSDSAFSFFLTLGLLAGVAAVSIFYSLGTDIAAALDDSLRAYKDRRLLEAEEKKRREAYTLDAIK